MIRSFVLRAPSTVARYTVPKHIQLPSYVSSAIDSQEDEFATAKAVDLTAVRSTCRLAAIVLNDICNHIQSLFTTNNDIIITTAQIDEYAARRIFELDAYPSCLGFHSFSKSICLSVNQTVAHGVPSDVTLLRRGDVLNVDVTLFKGGVHGDTARAIVVGEPDESRNAALAALFATARDALSAGIGAARSGARWTAIPTAIDTVLAERGSQFKVCHELGGHGIGRQFHQLPVVPMTMRSLRRDLLRRNPSSTIEIGDIFTIEPVVCLGSRRASLQVDPIDGWSLSLEERDARAVMLEHTILITKDGAEILTKI